MAEQTTTPTERPIPWKMERGRFIKAWVEVVKKAQPNDAKMVDLAEACIPLFLADNSAYLNAKVNTNKKPPTTEDMMKKCKAKCEAINKQILKNKHVSGQIPVPQMPAAVEKTTLKNELQEISGVEAWLQFNS